MRSVEFVDMRDTDLIVVTCRVSMCRFSYQWPVFCICCLFDFKVFAPNTHSSIYYFSESTCWIYKTGYFWLAIAPLSITLYPLSATPDDEFETCHFKNNWHVIKLCSFFSVSFLWGNFHCKHLYFHLFPFANVYGFPYNLLIHFFYYK